MRLAWVGRFLRYSAGSIAATVVSAVVLAASLRAAHVSAMVASILAFICGAIVAFVINRAWAWNRRDRAGMGRDFVKYAVVAITTAAAATACTTIAVAWARHSGLGSDERTLIAEGAYFGSYAVTFIFKFLLLDRYVFGVPQPVADPDESAVGTT